MTIEDPNLLERIKKIEKRLGSLEDRLESIERILNRPMPRPGPMPPPGPLGPKTPGPPDPFRF